MLAKVALFTSLLSGCTNHCQLVCENMAEFAKDECKIKVPESQIDDCVSAFEDSSDAEEEACETYSDIQAEEGWTCDIVKRYYDK